MNSANERPTGVGLGSGASKKGACFRVWSHEPLDSDVRESLEKVARIDDVEVVCAMPDVHLGSGVCVGAVVATNRSIFPEAIGGDIGCGMAALSFDTEASVLAERGLATKVMSMLGRCVPTSRHKTPSLPQELQEVPLSAASLERAKHQTASYQFATLGGGNHFVEFQRDEEGLLWLMLHSGSRGIGQSIKAEHGGEQEAKLGCLQADSEEGSRYMHDLEWALAYAKQSRRRMAEVVAHELAKLSGSKPLWDSYFDCHHNFVRREEHEGRSLWVHRKGAISAQLGEAGIIPGSMGTMSFHVRGRGNHESLCTSSHGAGRVMSRSKARKRIQPDQLLQQMRGIWFDNRKARRLCDEAPKAYKDIHLVMRAQRELTRIERKLTPILVYKGT
jgi:tRNA-splicing ligase RtcB